jgi:hypothetical protein
MINELKVKGSLDIVVRDKDGKVKDTRQVNNLVVDAGLDFIASRMTANTATVMSHMGIGTGSANPTAADTSLGSQAGSRETLDTIAVTDNAVAYTAVFEAGDQTGLITEAGIFNAASSGTMLCRSTFGGITKNSDDNMTIVWTITVSA